MICRDRRGHQPVLRRSASARARLDPIVEAAPLGADDLIRLVALAGDQHHVARLGFEDRALDGARAVELDLVSAAARQAGLDRLRNPLGRFRARIVVGDDRAVGAATDGFAHLRALVGIAIAAAAEHTDHAAGVRVPHAASTRSSASGVCA